MRHLGVLVICAILLSLAILPATADEDEGKALYDRKCALCHAKDGVAKKMLDAGLITQEDYDAAKAKALGL